MRLQLVARPFLSLYPYGGAGQNRTGVLIAMYYVNDTIYIYLPMELWI